MLDPWQKPWNQLGIGANAAAEGRVHVRIAAINAYPVDEHGLGEGGVVAGGARPASPHGNV